MQGFYESILILRRIFEVAERKKRRERENWGRSKSVDKPEIILFFTKFVRNFPRGQRVFSCSSVNVISVR